MDLIWGREPQVLIGILTKDLALSFKKIPTPVLGRGMISNLDPRFGISPQILCSDFKTEESPLLVAMKALDLCVEILALNLTVSAPPSLLWSSYREYYKTIPRDFLKVSHDF